jgi:hypothetical protein
MLAVGLAKGREVEAMLKAAPYQAYCLKRLRCVVGMMVKGGEEGGEEGEEEEEEEGQEGGDGGKKEEEGEGDGDATTSSSGPLKRTESQILTAAEEVRRSVMRRRQAVEPPRPMPRVEWFHHSGFEEEEESSTSRNKESEKVERGGKLVSAALSYPAIPPADLPARVLEEAVRTMNGDLFFELLDLLWAYGA